MRKRGLANRERRGWREGVVKEPLFSPRSSVSCGPAQLQGADGIIGQVFPSVFPVRRWEEEGRLVFLGGDKIKTVEDVSFHLHVLTSCRSTLLGWTRQEVEKGSLSHQLVSLKELSRESTSPPKFSVLSLHTCSLSFGAIITFLLLFHGWINKARGRRRSSKDKLLSFSVYKCAPLHFESSVAFNNAGASWPTFTACSRIPTCLMY